MSERTIESDVRQFAAETDALIWDEIPWGGATTLCAQELSLEEFLEMARALRVRIVYLDSDGAAAAFATDGVVHVYAMPARRRALLGEDSEATADSTTEGGDDTGRMTVRVENGQFDTDPYRDWKTGETVRGRVRAAVDAVVADERYDEQRNNNFLTEYLVDFDVEEAEVVERVARYVFREGIGKQLDQRVAELLQLLVKDPSYDPLAWGREIGAFIEDRVNNEDPRVIDRLARALSSHSYESGARAKAERDLVKRAKTLLSALPALERDRLGFASRSAAKVQLLMPYLEGETGKRAERISSEVSRLEEEQFGLAREERYATAARLLQAGGMTRAEVSRRLGVSPAILARITTNRRRDVDLASDDPIVAELAPGLL